VVGLALSIITVTIAVLRFRSDRVVVRVKGKVALPLVGGSFGPTQYAINAYNGGRRPVTLTGAGFDLSHDTTLPILTFQTTRLEDGEAVDAYIDIGELARAHLSEHGPLTAAWFRDAGDKRHRTAIPETKWLESWARH
jgi:hypothetical protein